MDYTFGAEALKDLQEALGDEVEEAAPEPDSPALPVLAEGTEVLYTQKGGSRRGD